MIYLNVVLHWEICPCLLLTCNAVETPCTVLCSFMAIFHVWRAFDLAVRQSPSPSVTCDSIWAVHRWHTWLHSAELSDNPGCGDLAWSSRISVNAGLYLKSCCLSSPFEKREEHQPTSCMSVVEMNELLFMKYCNDECPWGTAHEEIN